MSERDMRIQRLELELASIGRLAEAREGQAVYDAVHDRMDELRRFRERREPGFKQVWP